MYASNKQVVEKINDAFDKSDIDAFLSYCTENIAWNIIGDESFAGKDAIRNFMGKTQGEPPEFSISEIVAEGNTVMCYGDMKMKNKQDEFDDYSFCDVYHFKDGKVEELLTFMAKHKKK